MGQPVLDRLSLRAGSQYCARMQTGSAKTLNLTLCTAFPIAFLGALLALGGCKPDKKAGGQADGTAPAETQGDPAPASRTRGDVNSGSSGSADQARAIAEQAIRSTVANRNAQFRGVQVWSQAVSQHWAVCGQASPFADDENIFVPFVTVVTLDGNGRSDGKPVDSHVGISTTEADRVYVALVADCYDKGGPAPGALQSVTPLPPLPDTVANPHEPVVATATPPATAAPAVGVPGVAASAAAAPTGPAAGDAGTIVLPASGAVTMRQNANVHSAPHGPPVRVVPAGTVMHVFGQAGGGWYQVAGTAP